MSDARPPAGRTTLPTLPALCPAQSDGHHGPKQVTALQQVAGPISLPWAWRKPTLRPPGAEQREHADP